MIAQIELSPQDTLLILFKRSQTFSMGVPVLFVDENGDEQEYEWQEGDQVEATFREHPESNPVLSFSTADASITTVPGAMLLQKAYEHTIDIPARRLGGEFKFTFANGTTIVQSNRVILDVKATNTP
jgi:hypothetical protein